MVERREGDGRYRSAEPSALALADPTRREAADWIDRFRRFRNVSLDAHLAAVQAAAADAEV
jgi:hypothetical protein